LRIQFKKIRNQFIKQIKIRYKVYQMDRFHQLKDHFKVQIKLQVNYLNLVISLMKKKSMI
jgi:hypothetical protein